MSRVLYPTALHRHGMPGASTTALPGLLSLHEAGAVFPGCYTSRRPAMKCSVCEKDEQEVTLQKCPICFKLVCLDCAKREYGRTFCSKRCADQFFFGDDDE